jgi:pyruvate kinase
MNAQRGVVSVCAKPNMDHDDQVKFAISEARKMKYCKSGNKVITVHGMNEDSPDESNVMKILNVE